MTVIKGDIWKYWKAGNPICVTTNFNLTHSGNAVMGKGIALEAKKRCPDLALMLGQHLSRGKNTVKYFPEYNLFTFPTKWNWWEPSDIDLIVQSTKDLSGIAEEKYEVNERIYMPKVGCGNGKLHWGVVEPFLDKHLEKPSRYCVVDK